MGRMSARTTVDLDLVYVSRQVDALFAVFSRFCGYTSPQSL